MNERRLEELRREIDKVDEAIIELLGRRLKLAREIGLIKGHNRKIRDLRREQRVLERVKLQASLQQFSPEVAEKIYRILMDYFVSQQEELLRQQRRP
ncbi:MAG: chorismate mutase [Bacillota bacterium]|uniref:Chorismate mutase n=2 Tax=Carboxydocella TaxID=178898 RepID=A0A1T4PVT4_9FIRM|nr:MULTISPECIES: chorismate mutase [Carboxydocella]AVX20446.1 chorismate mutase [Carboxydocella thermautotrophica]AVX30867.1 chorismate mutase [Carboxydocella thermautotrophica]SJZ95341.1 chorismate mutase [Carboxydocella sporoproducens DSM 16521]GAW29737.1 prephenate dehydratase [Carboxydocella sp. ULO1]GAW32423.1 prephenate dehydratase [Carboxydocella sp. JDF658]